MVLPNQLFNILKKESSFFCGVPDSVLQSFTDQIKTKKTITHKIAVNEGSAVAMGVGYYLATKKKPCIYFQNSGLGNAFNPLISIAHQNVYSIPLILLIGWRGSPKSNDEPQHEAMGKITINTLKSLNIETIILNKKNIPRIKKKIRQKEKSLAILVPFKFFESKKRNHKIENKFLRMDFIKRFLETIPKKSKIISTVGYTSRELYQIRSKYNLTNGSDFYMVGGMGHASMVAYGYSEKKNNVFCLDGDGSFLMHMGSIRNIGIDKKRNFKHILLNNFTHESVGGMQTNSKGISFKNLVKSLGYKNYLKIEKKEEIKKKLLVFNKMKGPSFLEVIISEGTFKKLLRPKNLIKIKNNFIKK